MVTKQMLLNCDCSTDSKDATAKFCKIDDFLCKISIISISGFSGQEIKDVVNIGIGGSDLVTFTI